MTDIYSPPQSELGKEPTQNLRYGSIEKALNGDFDVQIVGTIKEAWGLVKGTKGSFFGAYAIYYLITFVIGGAIGLFTTFGEEGSSAASLFFNFIFSIALYPMFAGIVFLGIYRAVSKPISFSMIFEYYSKAVPIILLSILSVILVVVGIALLVIPGIYLAVAYIFALPLMVEKGLPVWEALETSRKAVTKQWFKVFGFLIVLAIICGLSMIPMMIGLIWTIPLAHIAYGILYRDIFGVSE